MAQLDFNQEASNAVNELRARFNDCGIIVLLIPCNGSGAYEMVYVASNGGQQDTATALAVAHTFVAQNDGEEKAMTQ